MLLEYILHIMQLQCYVAKLFYKVKQIKAEFNRQVGIGHTYLSATNIRIQLQGMRFGMEEY